MLRLRGLDPSRCRINSNHKVIRIYFVVCVGFLRVLRFPPTVQRHVFRLIGHAALPLGVSVCAIVCVCPAMDWRSVQGVSCLSPDDRWDRLQHPPATLREKRLRKWMDGWIFCVLWAHMVLLPD
ncbi:hypothetical protein AOLI_G00191920 [Acnodon oligacanthus]